MLLQSLLRPVLTPLMRGMFDAPIFSSSAWSPLALWPNGAASPGMWIDPSLLTASFNDSTGTTPVATPGTVADSANPVGLALDIRAGAPEVLGPELVVNGDFSDGATGWTLENEWTVGGGQASITNASTVYVIYQTGVTEGKTYLASFNVTSLTSGGFNFYCGGRVVNVSATSVGLWTAILVCGPNGIMGVCANSPGTTGSIDNISFKEVPGNHMLQATSAARPLESARVNLLQYTEDFTNGYWINATATVTPNYGTAPDGTQTSMRLQFAGTDLAILKANILSSPTPAAASCYVKGAAGETLFFENNLATVNLITLTGAWQLASKSSGDGTSFVIGTYGGATARDVQVWHPQLQLGLDATDYQSIPTDGSTYDATGITPFQLYAGVDDGMATASFAAGTLISGMDCMIAVRRDSVANCVAGLYNGIADATKFFGMAESASGSGCVGSGAGTPTVWVDNTQLTGGTAVTRGTLHTALTVGDYHILEFRGLDLSTWTAAGFGLYTSYVFPGARGDILLFPSTASTEDKDAARQYLADYYGVTLP